MRNRKERRLRSQHLALKRWRVWVGVGLDGDAESWQRPVHFFSKTKPWNCGCSKKHHGAPRQDGRGMCDLGKRKRIYRWRLTNRELGHVLHRGWDPDDDAVACLAAP